MSDDDCQPKKRGCAILFVPTLIVIDIVGMLSAGHHSAVASSLGIAGFVCGGALGAYYSVKANPQSRWSLSFWVLFLGLIGTMTMFIITYIFGLR